MENFTRRANKLDIYPARQLSFEERDTFGIKYLSGPVRVIDKIHYFVRLPVLYYTLANMPTIQYYPRCIAQFPVSMPEDFIILQQNPIIEFDSYLRNAFIAVRWIDDDDVTQRYVVVGSSAALNEDFIYAENPRFSWPQLGSQLVGAECVFELWAKLVSDDVGIVAPIDLKTAIIQNPETPDEQSVIVDATDTFELSEISYTLPQALPYLQPLLE